MDACNTRRSGRTCCSIVCRLYQIVCVKLHSVPGIKAAVLSLLDANSIINQSRFPLGSASDRPHPRACMRSAFMPTHCMQSTCYCSLHTCKASTGRVPGPASASSPSDGGHGHGGRAATRLHPLPHNSAAVCVVSAAAAAVAACAARLLARTARPNPGLTLQPQPSGTAPVWHSPTAGATSWAGGSRWARQRRSWLRALRRHSSCPLPRRPWQPAFAGSSARRRCPGCC